MVKKVDQPETDGVLVVRHDIEIATVNLLSGRVLASLQFV